MSLLKKYIIASTIALLNFGGELAQWTDEANRYFYQWEMLDGVARVLVIACLALLGVGLDSCLSSQRLAPWRRLYRYGLPVLLAGGLLACLPAAVFSWHPLLRRITWVGILALVGYCCFRKHRWIVRGSRTICLILSPIVPLIFFCLLTWDAWGTGAELRPGPYGKSDLGTPVVFLVFDEWSYQRTFGPDVSRMRFPNLQKLCDQSLFFKRAISPAHSTEHSLPGIIYQTTEELELNGATGWSTADGFVSSTVRSNIFDLARRRNYTTTLVGHYLPYRRILGDRVDNCVSYSGFPKGRGLFERMWFVLLENRWSLPFCGRIWSIMRPRMWSKHWFQINHSVRRDVLETLRDVQGRTFLFVHWPLPHHPFVLTANGELRMPGLRVRRGWARTPDGYEEHLRLLDKWLGEIVRELRERGKFDDSLLVVTSDHSWRRDPDERFRRGTDWKRHVPLILKLPGQRRSRIIERPFSLTDLTPILEAAMAGGYEIEALAEYVGMTNE